MAIFSIGSRGDVKAGKVYIHLAYDVSLQKMLSLFTGGLLYTSIYYICIMSSWALTAVEISTFIHTPEVTATAAAAAACSAAGVAS